MKVFLLLLKHLPPIDNHYMEMSVEIENIFGFGKVEFT